MRVTLIFFCCAMLFACRQPSKKSQVDSLKKPQLIEILQTDTLAKLITSADTNPGIVLPKGTIQVATDDKIDSLSKMRILHLGNFTAYDSYQIEKKLKWKGLFVKSRSYYIQETKLKVVKRTSNDAESSVDVYCDNKDTCELLISGGDIVTGRVKGVHLKKDELLPGQRQEFKYNGVTYIFYATGFKTDTSVTNFKLYLTANVKGHNFNQLISAIPDYGLSTQLYRESQASVGVAFAGDLDGDNIPDFIIVSGTDYSGDAILYLSKPAGNKLIVKPVAAVESND